MKKILLSCISLGYIGELFATVPDVMKDHSTEIKGVVAVIGTGFVLNKLKLPVTPAVMVGFGAIGINYALKKHPEHKEKIAIGASLAAWIGLSRAIGASPRTTLEGVVGIGLVGAFTIAQLQREKELRENVQKLTGDLSTRTQERDADRETIRTRTEEKESALRDLRVANEATIPNLHKELKDAKERLGTVTQSFTESRAFLEQQLRTVEQRLATLTEVYAEVRDFSEEALKHVLDMVALEQEAMRQMQKGSSADLVALVESERQRQIDALVSFVESVNRLSEDQDAARRGIEVDESQATILILQEELKRLKDQMKIRPMVSSAVSSAFSPGRSRWFGTLGTPGTPFRTQNSLEAETDQ